MKTFFIIFVSAMLFSISIACGTSKYTDRMPEKINFDSSMVIHLSHGGGMHYSSQDIYIRFDSCIRIDMEQGVDVRSGFAMNEELRKKITTVLNETNAMYISSQNLAGVNYDKATTEISITRKTYKDIRYSTGSSSKISERYQENFKSLWNKLDEFSLNKGVIK